jgi:hypothetical protein
MPSDADSHISTYQEYYYSFPDITNPSCDTLASAARCNETRVVTRFTSFGYRDLPKINSSSSSSYDGCGEKVELGLMYTSTDKEGVDINVFISITRYCSEYMR